MSLVIYVRLDPNANPAVVISERRITAKGEDILWRKPKNADPDFDFVRLDDLDQVNFPGQGIDKNRDGVRCNNRAPVGETEYPYTIVVESGGFRYDSTLHGAGRPQDKPVIRN